MTKICANHQINRHPSLMVRIGTTFLLSAAIAGCQTSGSSLWERQQADGFSDALSYYQAEGLYAERESISESMAVVTLSERDLRILEATERRYENGFSQRIIYPTKGGAKSENWIDVRVVGEAKDKKAVKDKLVLHSNQQDYIQHEAKTALPGLSFDKQPDTYFQNAYGAYGMYFARQKGNIGCLYGWQTLLTANVKASDHNGIGDARSWPAQRGVSYRLRYCAKGLGKRDAQSVMDQIRLAPHFARLWEENILLIGSHKDTTRYNSNSSFLPRIEKKKIERANHAHRIPLPVVPSPTNAIPHPEDSNISQSHVARIYTENSIAKMAKAPAKASLSIPIP